MKYAAIIAALVATTAHAQIPANTMFVTENLNGGTIALYKDSRCYTGIGLYSESPMQGFRNRGCVVSSDSITMHVQWDNGMDSYLDFTGWTQVGK